MAVAPIRRVHVLTHSSHHEATLQAIQDMGVMHVTELTEAEIEDLAQPVSVDPKDIEKRLQEVESAVSYLGRYIPSPGFMSSMAGGRLELTEDEFIQMSDPEQVEDVLREVRGLEQEVSELDIRSSRLESTRHHLEPWLPLKAPLEQLADTASTEVYAGSIPVTSFTSLTSALRDSDDGWVMEEISRSGGRIYLVLVELQTGAQEAERLLREAGFQPAAFPSSNGTVKEIIQDLDSEIRELADRKQSLLKRAEELSRHRINLMAAYDALNQRKIQIETMSKAATTENCIVLSGWCPADRIGTLEQRLEEIPGESAVLSREANEDENPPVALKNNTVVRPFTVVTNLYGLPKSTELDPTPLLAPFFVLSFGIAVGEGGYGVLLAVLSKLGLKFLKLDAGGRRLLNLLFYCGIATFIAGVLMGSFFAIDFSAVPEWMQPAATLFQKLQMLNPLEDSLLFLGIVLGLGFFQVWLGVLINGIIKWREGNRLFAVMHEGGWLVLLPFTALFGKTIAGIPADYIWYIAAASIFFSAGLAARGVGAKIGAGIYALYGITGFFGDILSYSRLFALGLATGVIATVVNILASMTKDIPIIGWLVMLVILAFGHLFNLAINALGAFIHTARLQFVEFFTKFFEGGGKRFEPFEKKYRYTSIVPGNQEDQ